jgi:hypothetical protein
VSTAWAHLHLPRLRSGTTADVISLKVPGQSIDYVSVVNLTGVRFVVHERGRQRCVREGIRNVHAWVVGADEGHDYGPCVRYDTTGFRKAVYDPFKGGAFVDSETLEPVHTAAEAVLSGKNVWYRTEE